MVNKIIRRTVACFVVAVVMFLMAYITIYFAIRGAECIVNALSHH